MNYTNHNQLERIVNPETLERAWKRIRSKRSKGGLDGKSVDDFAKNIKKEIEELNNELIKGTYVPKPLLRLDIQKTNKPGEVRSIGLPSIRDKIAQEAVRSVIEPLIDRHFLNNSYGYRPGKGARKAVKRVVHIINQFKMKWVAVLDIDEFFPTIDHDILLEKLRSFAIEEPVCRLLLLWLKMGTVTPYGKWLDVYHGVSQGGVISPFLANLYLHSLDVYLSNQNVEFVRYADDIRLFFPSRQKAEETVKKVIQFLESELKLKVNHLPELITPVESGFSFLGIHFSSGKLLIDSEKWSGIQDKLQRIFYNSNDWNTILQKLNEFVVGWKHYYGALVDQGEVDRFQREVKQALVQKLANLFAKNAAGIEDIKNSLEFIEISALTSGSDRKAFLNNIFQHARELSKKLSEKLRIEQNVERLVRKEKKRYVRHVVQASHLVINTPGSFIGKSGNRIVIRQNRKILYEVPILHLESITLLSQGVSLSSDLITLCSKEGIPLFWTSSKGDVEAMLYPPNPTRVELQIRQLKVFRDFQQNYEIARSFVIGKIKNQIHLIKYFGKYEKRQNTSFMDSYRRFEESATKILTEVYHLKLYENLEHTRGHLFSIEGRLASHYWDMVRLLLKRVADFPGRQHQEATDLVNKLLNYGYAVLQSCILLEIYRSGLNPYISFLHIPQKGNPTLAFDIMEIFRPQGVDRVIISELRRRSKVFKLDKDGQLSQETRLHLIKQIYDRLGSIELFRGRELKFEEIIREQIKDLRHHIEGKTYYRPYVGKW